ncbi:MAG: prepilin peptidase, partial [Acidimicrobiales bacterium]
MTPGGTPYAVAVVASGLAGLAVGSFLNVVAYRVPLRMSVVRPASHCPTCGTTLTALDTVPVASWVALRGRCRHCRAPVSARYPLVELLTGVTLAAVAAAVGWSGALASLDLVAACAIGAALVDAERIPVPGFLDAAATLGALTLVAVAVAWGEPGRLEWAVLGAAVTAAACAVTDALGTGRKKEIGTPGFGGDGTGGSASGGVAPGGVASGGVERWRR